jgi:tRNA(Ile)-lysidine synthase
LARALGMPHRILRWGGKKPKSALQEMARIARYRLLAEVARNAKASHILTAHTRDDQAETVLIRMSRGSGLAGLAAMAKIGALPIEGHGQIKLVRPLLDVPKMRLVATLRAAKIPFADDPSNRDPRFTRTRLRGLAEQLAREGLDSRRLALLAQRLKRADQAIEAVVERAEIELTQLSRDGMLHIDAAAYGGLPTEIGLRLLGRVLSRLGHEGPVELGKLEVLKIALDAAQKTAGGRFRRSLAGAIVTLADGLITIEGAPPRRGKALTTRRSGKA